MKSTIAATSIFFIITILHSQQSPGDTIGYTAYDNQSSGSFGQRLVVDDLGQAHIDWMYMDFPGQTIRCCAWNARFVNGTYYGETQASNSWSGYVRIDITRDSDPNNQRSAICYHYDPGSGYYSWVDIDAGNVWGSWPNNPQRISDDGYIWSCLCITSSHYIHVAAGSRVDNTHRVYRNDSLIFEFDSAAGESHFLRSSRNTGSDRVVFAHTRHITDTIPLWDNDVWFIVSNDGGAAWGSYTNLTNYQPIDSVRACVDVSVIFDNSDNMHFAWTGRKIDSLQYYQASKIFHWDEINDTITVVSSPSIYYNEPGGWWIKGSLGNLGGWRCPADEPQLVIGPNDILYCLWHGQDDTTDVSAGGFVNHDLYGAYSTDGGVTWSDYVNLTNTDSHGAPPGSCLSEDFMTANPFVYNDSIWLTYVCDKDAGVGIAGQGVVTENPVYCWIFPKTMITGIKEFNYEEPSVLSLQVAPNPFQKELKIQYALSSRHNTEGVNGLRQNDIELHIYDACGRVVKSITQLPNCPITWSGDDLYGASLPAGIYFITLTSGDQVTTTKVIKLE